MEIIDVTTTSVGRMTIKTTYDSFFQHIHFSGKYRFHVTIDPAYGVEEHEIQEVLKYLHALEAHPRVESIEVTRLEKAVGLEGCLMLLFAQCHEKYGINLEDDWLFFASLSLDDAILTMQNYSSCMVAFSSTHIEKRNTFSSVEGVEQLETPYGDYVKLIPPNWACDYIPLAPHIHDNQIWIPAYIKGLLLNSAKERCPDERTKEYVRSHGLRQVFNVLWTKEIIVEDIGRKWLVQHGRSKRILPDMEPTFQPPSALKPERDYLRSKRLFERALHSIPGQTQTFMKRGKLSDWPCPLYAERGEGSRFYDIDGNCFIDYVAGLGVLQLGYAHPAMKEAVVSHLSRGVFFSLPTWFEIEAAELLKEVVPNAEMTRFLKSGGDACSAAVTLARYITGRQDILHCGYHGWHEQFQPFQPGAYKALAKGSVAFDIERDSIDQLLNREPYRFACVVLAMPYKNPVSQKVINEIRHACTKYGVLLVLDDVVTGFRLALGGAQEYYHFDADIIVLSKALTAGAELAAVCGKRIYMEKFSDLYVSTTMGGEVTALQCLINAVNIYRSTDLISRMHRLGQLLKNLVNAVAERVWGSPLLFGYHCMPYLEPMTSEQSKLLTAFLLQRGIYMRPGCNFITGAHTEEDIRYTASVFQSFIEGSLS